MVTAFCQDLLTPSLLFSFPPLGGGSHRIAFCWHGFKNFKLWPSGIQLGSFQTGIYLFFCFKMVGLIIPGVWVVLFQLTSQVSSLYAALYSVPGECQLSLNVDLSLTYSNCCDLNLACRHEPQKIHVLLYPCEWNRSRKFVLF